MPRSCCSTPTPRNRPGTLAIAAPVFVGGASFIVVRLHGHVAIWAPTAWALAVVAWWLLLGTGDAVSGRWWALYFAVLLGTLCFAAWNIVALLVRLMLERGKAH